MGEKPMPSTSRGPSRLTRATLAALVLVAVAALAGCDPPIVPQNRPRPPVGVQNGALPATELAVVNGCQVHRSVYNALLGLLMHSAHDQVQLRPGSCYRDLAGQVGARQRACDQGNCATAATPGYSNHGWGKAVDFVTDDGRLLTFDSPSYTWLRNNGWQKGWNHPDWAEPNGSTPEPWHWEWVGDGGSLYPGTTIGPQT
jgi:hypothetical protein